MDFISWFKCIIINLWNTHTSNLTNFGIPYIILANLPDRPSRESRNLDMLLRSWPYKLSGPEPKLICLWVILHFLPLINFRKLTYNLYS